ncbi:hypothetical protein HDU97_004070 [Phlyctochytrium planicorne]|nr:hypothetical protein HDU97_004070 [Phlyctochytrium planicorne]
MLNVAILLLAASASCLIPQADAYRSNVDLSARSFSSNAVSSGLTKGPATSVVIPTGPQFQSVVKPLIANIDTNKIKSFVNGMISFPERYYKSQNGIAAAKWIRDQVAALPVAAGAKLTVKLFDHSWNVQPSVIARYEPATPSALEGIIITGSHLDTLGSGSGKPEPNNNPAADDCASGSSAVFEALRVLTTSGFVPARPIEYHWYSGEEEGILGSNEVAEAYAKAGVKVVSYLNLDQSGYTKPGKTPVMGVLLDYTTSKPTAFLKNVITTYTTLGFVTTKCGYKCTDNSAWYDHGYEVGFAAEAAFSDSFQGSDKVNSDGSPIDVVGNLNFTHITEFAKSTIAYTVELAQIGSGQPPVSSTTAVSTSTVAPGPTAVPVAITVAPTVSVVVVTKTPSASVPVTSAAGTTTVTLTVAPTYAVSVVTAGALNARFAKRQAATTTVTVTVAPNIQLSVATGAALLQRRGGAGGSTTTPAPTTTTVPSTTVVPPAKTSVTFKVAPTYKVVIAN